MTQTNLPKAILHIDDDPVMREVTAMIFTRSAPSIKLKSAAHIEEALHALENFTPVLILLDIHMPDMNGFEMLSLLREHPSAKNCPVIFLTGNALLADTYRQDDPYILGVIKKPFLPDRFLDAIKKYWENKEKDKKSA